MGVVFLQTFRVVFVNNCCLSSFYCILGCELEDLLFVSCEFFCQLGYFVYVLWFRGVYSKFIIVFVLVNRFLEFIFVFSVRRFLVLYLLFSICFRVFVRCLGRVQVVRFINRLVFVFDMGWGICVIRLSYFSYRFVKYRLVFF